MRSARIVLALTSALGVPWAPLFVQPQPDTASHAPAPMAAEPSVVTANRAVLSELPFSDRQDFEDANRGFIATTASPYAGRRAQSARWRLLTQCALLSGSHTIQRCGQIYNVVGDQVLGEDGPDLPTRIIRAHSIAMFIGNPAIQAAVN